MCGWEGVWVVGRGGRKECRWLVGIIVGWEEGWFVFGWQGGGVEGGIVDGWEEKLGVA